MHSRGAFVDTCGNKRKINQIDIFSKFWSLCFVCSVQRQRAYAKHQAYVIGNGRLKMSVWSSKNYSMLNRQFAPLSLYLHIYLYNIQTSEPHTHTHNCAAWWSLITANASSCQCVRKQFVVFVRTNINIYDGEKKQHSPHQRNDQNIFRLICVWIRTRCVCVL